MPATGTDQLLVRVYDVTSGVAICDANVTINGVVAWLDTLPDAEPCADNSYTTSADFIDGGPATISVTHPGYLSVTLSVCVQPGLRTEIVVELQPGP